MLHHLLLSVIFSGFHDKATSRTRCVLLRRILDPLSGWLFAPTPRAAERLGVYRIFFSCFYLWRLSLYHLKELADMPDFLWHPPALFWWVRPPPNYAALESLLAGALVFLLFGWFTRCSTWVVLVLGVWFNLSKASILFVDLSLFLVTFWVPVFMVWSDWGSRYSIDSLMRRPNRNADVDRFWTVRGLLLCLSILYFTAGWSKLTHSWVENPRYVADLLLSKGVESFIANGAPMNPVNPYLSKAPYAYLPMQFGALFFELSFPVVLFSHRLRRYYFRFVPAFHAVNMFCFGIPVVEIIGVYGAFVHWHTLRERIAVDPQSFGLRVTGLHVKGACVTLFAFTVGSWNTQMSVRSVLNLGGMLKSYEVWVLVACVVAVWWSVLVVKLLWFRRGATR
jgi:hypothetical protein